VAKLSPPRTARPACFAYSIWWKVVMQTKPLPWFAPAVSINHLRFLDWGERSERDRLGFAALENGRTMRARQDAHFATDRPQILVTAAIDAFLFFQNADAKRLFLDVIECL